MRRSRLPLEAGHDAGRGLGEASHRHDASRANVHRRWRRWRWCLRPAEAKWVTRSTVKAINFGSSPLEPQWVDGGGPLNRRAEMWMKSKEWLEDVAGAQIPDSDSLQADACGPSYKWDSNTRLVLEKKEDMRRRDVPSPDEWDAVALTFAEPVAPDWDEDDDDDPGSGRGRSSVTGY
jgi:hypothetical protein